MMGVVPVLKPAALIRATTVVSLPEAWLATIRDPVAPLTAVSEPEVKVAPEPLTREICRLASAYSWV
ncbi:hypothetical protein [Geotalea toluenoxydans]|uniref:hypothetical protein n=1 Tax=Geotalea toluenoxydans TaxID=421624 RepID=UPI001FB2CDE3|nr:hypothetical protein [Geotalea toluenoxydans]